MIRNIMSPQDATDDDASLRVWYAINSRHALGIQKIYVGNNTCAKK